MILKQICTVCIEIGDFIGFSKFTGSKLDIQNGGLHWLKQSQKFDFGIAVTSLLISDFDQVCSRLQGLIRACMSDTLAFSVAVP